MAAGFIRVCFALFAAPAALGAQVRESALRLRGHHPHRLAAAYRQGEKLFFRFDGHLTPSGHRVVAEVFVSEIAPKIGARGESTEASD